ncbi:MAG: gamma-glutamyltransferase, partial [Phenylobacterium sp.]
MRRRTFLASLPAAAMAGSALANSRAENPNRDRPDVRSGDRIDGATFASRSAAWGVHGAAATAHTLATLPAVEILNAGGSAVDAAVAANAVLGFGEPIACGIGGDCFVMLWDPKLKKVVGLNGSGRSPRGLSLETVRARSKDGRIPSYGAISVSVPGAVDAWWSLHQRYGKLPWRDLFAPAIRHAED